MLNEKNAPAECGLPLPLDGDDEDAALDEDGVSPSRVSMTRIGTCFAYSPKSFRDVVENRPSARAIGLDIFSDQISTLVITIKQFSSR